MRLLLFSLIGILLAALAITIGRALADTRQRALSLESRSIQIETRHGRLEYSVTGSGMPVLVIHGAGGGFDQGELLADALGGDGFRWIAVSRFGYLRSELPPAPSTPAQADALVELLDALAVERVGVLAMSGGVPPALQLAARHPDRVGPMVLLSSAPFTPYAGEILDRPIPTWMHSLLLGNDVVYWLLTRVARSTLAEAFDARAELRRNADSSEQAFVDALIDGFLPASKRLPGVNNEGAAVDPTTTYDLAAIRAPVLVVHADDDRLNPIAIAAALAKGIGNARLLSLEQGGHLLLGHHRALSVSVADFLSQGFSSVP